MTSPDQSSVPVRAAFDLTTEPWIPVVRGGVETEVSLRDAVLLAHEIDSLSFADGPQFAGLLRLLSALVMSAYGKPRDRDQWAELYRGGSFETADLDAYFERIGRSRFDLFDADRPFFQSAAVTDDPKTNAEIMPHVAAGNTPPIFSPDTEKKPRSLTPAQAARTLVGFMAVAVAGLGRAKAIEGSGWAGASFGGRVGQIGFIAPVGVTLFDTILLNMPIGVGTKGDQPQWERTDAPPAGRAKRAATGVLDMLTWCPRRVKLIANEDGTVTHLRMLGGDGLTVLDKQFEPHTEWRTSDGKDGRTPGDVYQRKHLIRTLGWRGLPNLLALRKTSAGDESSMLFIQLSHLDSVLPEDYPISIAGLNCEYGNMAATFADITFDVFSLPFRAFGPNEGDVRADLTELVQRADRVARLVRTLAWSVSRVVLRDSGKDAPYATAYAGTLTARFTTDVEAVTRRFLAGLTAHPRAVDAGIEAWDQGVYKLALRYRDEVVATATGCLFDILVSTAGGTRKVLAMPPTVSDGKFHDDLGALIAHPATAAAALATESAEELSA
ncbi:type I-E CRISPR-associated protein Cse1/CasA [Jatrophihabitans lederbergiae]|uniref:Type I-E CRISPR-associated protein Cse1/CasA n=1 Tax=Jatrophihabitans lederbergiae TaxID=3075547 RepID=A0ABU2JH29_9ACTN|nr:type I-E CRISPR-associated protein Cse1/CasA [Jatrophihabitans sp. DSM 44399]MDT0263794.1 type I-E CRISPR-associated protein Cse1/CasA [Jatrophihabitans sp. DSM 44399]